VTPSERLARKRASNRRTIAAARARQKALDPTRNWRAEEYQLTKFKRATAEGATT